MVVYFQFLAVKGWFTHGDKVGIRVRLYSSRKHPYSPTEGIGISWGGGWVGVSPRPKHLKKCIKLNWNF